MRKLEQGEVISKFKNIHRDKFNYSLVEYSNMKTKVKLICPNNHIFEQTPDNHLKGKGCGICLNKLIFTKEDFIQKSSVVHNNKFEYSKVNYADTKTKVEIICPNHGSIFQTPNQHLIGRGCELCRHETLKRRDPISELIKKHDNRYDYSKSVYIKGNLPIIIICKIHGEFRQSYQSHLDGSGCKKCMIDKFSIGFNKFLEKANSIWNNKYKYIESSYINQKTNISIICQKHGEFKVTPDNHLSKMRGCPKCGGNVSKMEISWLDLLNIEESKRQIRTKINGKVYKFDAFCDDTKTIYEFYGDYWHGNPLVCNPIDLNKRNKVTFGELYRKTIEREQFLIDTGYKVISIWERDFKKLTK